MLGALVFNVCLFALPLALGAAFMIIARDHLYAYEYSEAGARAVSTRVERLNGNLIQLDFDRQRQWDDLIALELMRGDISAARGFLLSARGMLPSRVVNSLNQRLPSGGDDAQLELAALALLTPGTRARYEATVPLLSRRTASGAAQARDDQPAVEIGDARDFEILARAMLVESEPDLLQFVLTGFSRGLAGEFTPRMSRGAAALLAASRRDDFQQTFASQLRPVMETALPLATFRDAARTGAGAGDPGAYDNAAAAFREALSPEGAAAAKQLLDNIGAMADSTTIAGAAALLTHASTLNDMPRLLLVAQAAGDRAAAAAKRLPRDGRLLSAARGELTVTRELSLALAAAGAALLGLLAVLGFVLFQIGRRIWLRMQDDDYAGELVDISASNWRPL
ncbi:MAG: hypothetical protein JNK94_00260 [Hyphomonadaceae bacterium]|nr:hypothetical protein [Hyphomonadaceae bacterium]